MESGMESIEVVKKQSSMLNWDIILKNNKTNIGNIYLEENKNKFEVKIFIEKKFRDNGYGTEALNKIMNYMNENKKVFKVYAIATIENISFARILVKNGFFYDEESEIFEYRNRK